jgi:hypothetical protein
MRERPICLAGRLKRTATCPSVQIGCSRVRPRGGAMTAEVLSDVLRAVHLTGAVYFDLE